MLSREEQQRLTEIERAFSAAEPDLARTLSGGPLAQRAHRRLVAAFTAALIGALLVGFGVVVVSTAVALTGVLALTAAACLYLSRSHDA